MYVRYLPSLMDRLTDHAPRRKTEPAERRYVSFQQYRSGFLRSMGSLLGYGLQPSPLDLTQWPEVARSVINYGMRSRIGQTGLVLDPQTIENDVKQAILAFEPRIKKETLEVHVLSSGQGPGPGVQRDIEFEINAELWAKPFSEYIYILSKIDLETYDIRVEEWRNG